MTARPLHHEGGTPEAVEPGALRELSREWRELAEALKDFWDLTKRLPEEKMAGQHGAERVLRELRIESQRSYEALQGTLELAGKDQDEIHRIVRELIVLAGEHEREYFVDLLTDPKISSGKAKEISSLLSDGLSSKVKLEHRDDVEEERREAA